MNYDDQTKLFHMKNHSVHTFPTLNIKELCGRLGSIFDREFPEQSLKDPVDVNFIRGIYESILSRIGLIEPPSLESHFQQNHTIYEKGVRECEFIEDLRVLLKASGIDDFSPYMDLWNPTSARTIRLLSGIVNLINYLDDYAFPQHSEYTKDVAMLNQEKDLLEEEIEKKTLEYNNLVNKAESEKPDVSQLQDQIQTLTQEIYHLNKQQASLQYEIEKLKGNLKTEKTEVNTKREETQRRLKHLEELRSKIIPSPEELPKHLDELSQSLEHTVQETQHQQKKINQLQEKTQILQKNQLPLRKLREDLEQEVKKKTELTEIKGEIDTLNRQKQQLVQTIQTVREKRELKKKRKEYLLTTYQQIETTYTSQLQFEQQELARLEQASKDKEQLDRITSFLKSQEDSNIAFFEERKKQAFENYKSFHNTLEKMKQEINSELVLLLSELKSNPMYPKQI